MNAERKKPALRIALLAGSNLDLLEKPLTSRLLEKEFAATIWNPGFNQYRQAILDPSSGLYEEKAEAILLFLAAADLFAGCLANPYGYSMAEIPAIVEAARADVAALVRTIAERLPSATVLLNTLIVADLGGTYHGLEYNSGFSFRQIVATYNACLRELARGSSNVVVVDVEALVMETGAERWYDPRLWYLGRIPLSAQAHGLLASEYANIIAARWGSVRKCIVLDLDNTLWGGVIGEDGMTGIQLGHEGIGLAFVDFQRELLNLRQKGILLAICSKNNPEDAYEAIRKHPAMVLREEHFAAIEINWNDKADNIREIARRLNIGVDSLVFIDDSPVERKRVREAIKEVAVPEWPNDPCESTRALGRVAGEYFLKFDISEEDSRRGEMYHSQAERERLAENAGNLDDFFRSLQMKITIGRADHETLPRVTELTQKTNQFNLTTRRYTESELATITADEGRRVYWLNLEDRFGPNGIVGVLIFRRESNEQWLIDTFLLSCRVIGRTVEEALLGYALRELRELGATELTGEYIPTGKNGMVANLYGKLGFALTDSNEKRTLWTLDLKKKSIEVPAWFEIADHERISAQ
jgi:FkbH-like protein